MQEKFEDKVKSLIEQRVIEATKKQITKKLFCIAKQMGRPIISQSIVRNKFNEIWRYEEDFIYEPQTLVQEPHEWDTLDMGYYFDGGLKCGLNLCVTAMVYDEKLSEIKATYNGYLVFAEAEGELKAYAPFPLWEEATDMFYAAALEKEKQYLLKEKESRKERNKQKMFSFWQKFRAIWGY